MSDGDLYKGYRGPGRAVLERMGVGVWSDVEVTTDKGSFRRIVGPLLLLTPIFFLNFMARIIQAPLMPAIERELGISHGEAGALFFTISIGYFISLMGSGFVSARLRHTSLARISKWKVSPRIRSPRQISASKRGSPSCRRREAIWGISKAPGTRNTGTFRRATRCEARQPSAPSSSRPATSG